MKLALFGPIAGIGDAIFWFTILPIVAGISCSFASQGSILGPIIFFLVYLAIWILRIVWTHLGYNLGTKSINLLPVIEVDGGIKVAVQTEFFDKIFPNFLPMCVTLLCFWLLKKKQVSPIVLIVAIIVLSIVASAVGLL